MFSGYMDELKLYGKALDKETIMVLASFQAPEIAYEDIGLQNILTEDTCFSSRIWWGHTGGISPGAIWSVRIWYPGVR